MLAPWLNRCRAGLAGSVNISEGRYRLMVMGRTASKSTPYVPVVLAFCVAASLPACASGTHATSAGPGASAPSQAKASSPRQRAADDAASILASFVPPPGAQRISQPPDGIVALLGESSDVPMTPTVVRDTAWWKVPGSAQGALNWEKAHLPGQFTLGAYSEGDPSSEIRVVFDQFDLPPVPTVLTTRDLQVSAVHIPAGPTYLMVESQVIWLPRRPASSLVPARARAIIVSYARGRSATFPLDNRPATSPPPVTVADPAKVQQVAALVNGLEFPPGPHSCPADPGEEKLILTFVDHADGAALAVYVVDLAGCEAVAVSVGGVRQASLQFSAEFVQQVLRVAGMRLKPYS